MMHIIHMHPSFPSATDDAARPPAPTVRYICVQELKEAYNRLKEQGVVDEDELQQVAFSVLAIAALVPDRHAVEKCFADWVSKEKATLAHLIPNHDELSDAQKEKWMQTVYSSCTHHAYANTVNEMQRVADIVETCLKATGMAWEDLCATPWTELCDLIRSAVEGMIDKKQKCAESSAVKFVRETIKFTGSKAGVKENRWGRELQAYERVEMGHDDPLCRKTTRFVGSRTGSTIENAAACLMLHEEGGVLQKFTEDKKWETGNAYTDYTKQFLASGKDTYIQAACRAFATVHDRMMKPAWCEMAGQTMAGIAPFVQETHNKLQTWADDPETMFDGTEVLESPASHFHSCFVGANCNVNVWDVKCRTCGEKYATCDCFTRGACHCFQETEEMDYVLAPWEGRSVTLCMLSFMCQAGRKLLGSHKEDCLEGGLFADPASELHERVAHADCKNDICEALLGMNDDTRQQSRNFDQYRVGGMILARKLNVVEGILRMPPDLQEKYVRAAQAHAKAHRERVGSMQEQEDRMYQASLAAKVSARETRKNTALKKAQTLQAAREAVGDAQGCMYPTETEIQAMNGETVNNFLRLWQVHKPSHTNPKIVLTGKVADRQARLVELVTMYAHENVKKTADAPAVTAVESGEYDGIDAESEGEGEDETENGEGFGAELTDVQRFGASAQHGVKCN